MHKRLALLVGELPWIKCEISSYRFAVYRLLASMLRFVGKAGFLRSALFENCAPP
jgi:hypothetical protein